MQELLELPNIGKVLAEQLREVGINKYEELKQIGSKEAWIRIKLKDPTSCLHKLTALEGAIEGIPKKYLKEERKQELKKFFDEYEKL